MAASPTRVLNRRALAALASAAAVALAGCAPHISLSKPDDRLPTAYETPAGAMQASLPAATLDRWWLLFGDAQLTSLIDQALAASPDAKAALGRLNEARAVRASALSPFWPKGNLQGSAVNQYSEQKFSGNFFGFAPSGMLQTYSVQFPASWELDLFGDIRIARRQANADLAAARFDYEATRMSLAAEVATSLFQARGLAAQLQDARESARIAHELVDVAARKAAHGLGTSADTARLLTQAQTADAEVSRLEAAERAAVRSLLVLIGKGGAPLETIPIEPEAPPAPPVPASTPGELLARRPDVREAQARLVSATGVMQLDRMALFPNLQLQGNGSLEKTTGAYFSTTKLWSIGLGFTAPVLDRPRLLAELRAQTARAEQAVAAYEKAVQSAYGDAENALTTLDADRQRATLLTDAEAQARFALDVARKGYSAGLTDLTTLLQTEQNWQSARANLTAIRIAELQDSVAAFKALGGGWTPLPGAGGNVKTTARLTNSG